MKGSVIKYERDNIDTDVILPGPYLKIHDYNELAKHAMEGIDKDFHKKVKPGDFITPDNSYKVKDLVSPGVFYKGDSGPLFDPESPPQPSGDHQLSLGRDDARLHLHRAPTSRYILLPRRR